MPTTMQSPAESGGRGGGGGDSGGSGGDGGGTGGKGGSGGKGGRLSVTWKCERNGCRAESDELHCET